MNQITRDVDRVWLSDAVGEIADSDYMASLSELSTAEAIASIKETLRSSPDAGLKERLGSLGIALGDLTPSREVPSGVFSVWRSTTPMILLQPEALRSPDLGYRIAKAIGSLLAINGKVDEAEIEQNFGEAFTVLESNAQPEIANN